MLPLSAIRAVHESVDDQWRSPVVDAVATRWGIAPGAALQWRSSASHVFVVPPGGDDRGVLYVRFVPAALRSRVSIGVPAELLAALAAAGGDVVEPVASLDGNLVETITTPLGDVHAVVVPQAPGAELDVDDLGVEQAAAWGAALARFHLAAAPHAALLALLAEDGDHAPRNEGNMFGALEAVADDAQDGALATAAGRLGEAWAREVEGLPSGVLHGDYELDNLRWEGTGVVAFDLDETSLGPWVLDLASAVRDLVGEEGTIEAPEHPDLLAAFLSGYSGVRALGQDEVGALALAGVHVAARSIVHCRDVLDVDEAPGDPQWLVGLRARLVAFVDRARDTVLAASATLA